MIQIEQFNEKKDDEEEHLSQQLGQLSAHDHEPNQLDTESTITITKKRPVSTPTTTTAPSSIIKKIKTIDEYLPLDYIPKYLSKEKGLFDKMLVPILNKTRKYIDIEDLRTYAHVIEHLKCIELQQSLWNRYLQSGTGDLINDEHIRSVIVDKTRKLPIVQLWPMQVKSRMMKRGETNITNPARIDNQSCFDYVRRVLLKYDNQIVYYQEQFKVMKQRLKDLVTEEIENAIIHFLQQNGIIFYRIHINGTIITVEYDYRDEILQLEFEERRPNKDQRKLFDNLFELKREKEQAKLDVAILKQRIAHKHLPKSFDSLQIPKPIDLNTIRDIHVRQRLNEQCQKILERTRSDMILIYIAMAETKLNECYEKWNRAMNEFKQSLKIDMPFETLDQKMIDIMYRRFKNLDERLLKLYNLKLHFFDVAPTVTN